MDYCSKNYAIYYNSRGKKRSTSDHHSLYIVYAKSTPGALAKIDGICYKSKSSQNKNTKIIGKTPKILSFFYPSFIFQIIIIIFFI